MINKRRQQQFWYLLKVRFSSLQASFGCKREQSKILSQPSPILITPYMSSTSFNTSKRKRKSICSNYDKDFELLLFATPFNTNRLEVSICLIIFPPATSSVSSKRRWIHITVDDLLLDTIGWWKCFLLRVHSEGENERKSHKYTNCMLKGLNLKCNIHGKSRGERVKKRFHQKKTNEG